MKRVMMKVCLKLYSQNSCPYKHQSSLNIHHWSLWNSLYPDHINQSFRMHNSSLLISISLSLLVLHLVQAWDTSISFFVFWPYHPYYLDDLPQNGLSNINFGNLQATGGVWVGGALYIYRPSPEGAPNVPGYVANGMCTNVPPGFCCRTIEPGGSKVEFTGLPLGAIAAIWQTDGPNSAIGCDGRVLDSHHGGPRWTYSSPGMEAGQGWPRISGGSYIQCPGANVARGWVQILAGFCTRLNRKMAAATAKPTTGYPDVITFNGTNFTDGRRGDLLYRSSAGGLLNLTSMRST